MPAVSQRMTRQRLGLCATSACSRAAGPAHLERIAAVGNLMHMERGAAEQRRQPRSD
jgi:hypothetical protein